MRIDKPILGKLTQGTIFTSAQAEEYVGYPTWGLCITARCDMAHENKTNVFNYLPIVTVDAWLMKDGARLLADRLYSELRTSAATALKNAKKSSSVLDSYTPEFVAKNIMAGDNRFQELAERLGIVEKFRADPNPSTASVAELALINRKCSERLMKDLWSLQLAGYYYLHQVGSTEHECETGYVVLLREVHHLPRTLGRKIADGMLIENTSLKINGGPAATLFDFACPTGLIASPWIEHIMQQFSLLFVRIGLPDPNPLHLTALNERVTRGS